jgi:hypothetical protein
MPRAYDRNIPQDDHNPLVGLLAWDTQAQMELIGSKFQDSFTLGIIKTVKDLTGLDFTNVDTFVASLVAVITEGGNAILQPWIDLFNRVFGNLPGGQLDSLEPLLGLLKDLAQSAWDGVQQVGDTLADMWAFVQQGLGTIIQVLQGVSEDIILPPLELLQSLWFWFTGLFGLTNQANSSNNPAITTTAGRLGALEAQIRQLVSGGSTAAGGGDTFNDGLFARWAAVGGLPFPPALGFDLFALGSGNFWSNGVVKVAAKWVGDAVMPVESATGHYRMQAAVVDFGYGRSRMIAQANTGYTNCFVIELDRDAGGVDIKMGSAGAVDGTITVRDLHHIDSGGLKKADVLGIEVDESTAGGTTYTVRRNDTGIGSWHDTGAVVGSGVAHRRMAMLTNMDNTVFQPGCGWEAFSFWDVPG